MKLLYGMLIVILFSPLVWAQQQGEDEFPIGVFSDSLRFFTNDLAYDTLIDLGINYVIEDVSVNTKSRLQPFNVIASNADAPSDVIQHYSNAIYSVWEAENDKANFWGTGFKHTAGIKTTYNGKFCWSTDTLTTRVDSLLFGPYYSQEKKYHRLNYRPWWNRKIEYKVRYRIALEDKPPMPGNTEVCKLRVNYVVNTYNPKICSLNTALNTTIQFEEQILTLDDFPTDNFYTFEVDYEFPDSLVPTYQKYGRILYDSEFEYSDICPATGAEFALDWSGIGKLYIDYVDVVDELGEAITDPDDIDDIQILISNYLAPYYNWDNLTYWYIRDEPHWLDCYLPAKIIEGWVDSISSGRFHTITEFYPHWANQKNGDEDIEKYVEIAQPYKLMIDSYPFSENATEPLSFYLNLLRNKFQSAAVADSNFWYVAQGFGQKTDLTQPEYCGWRRPDSAELKASVMLALAHGSKGIMFWKYFTNNHYGSGATCPDTVASEGIVGLMEDGFPKSDLWYLIKNNLAPRLKGKLGKTLLSLDYTGNFLQLQATAPTETPDPVTYDYLTLGLYAMQDDMNWHVGFLEPSNQPDNKHFLLANLWTISDKSVNVKVTAPVPGYANYSFRNVEPSYNFDTTFTTEITTSLTHPKGEGYLFQVAPVVKYGGRLIYPEEIASETLYDDMVIENGATLGISGDYYVDADIIVKDGGSIVNTGNGKIIFYNDHKLILQGNSTLSSLSQNKLVLDFVSPTENNGIIADSGLVIIISNCEIKNAGTGITVSSFSSLPPESDDFRFRVDSVDFIGCEEFGINITGQYVNKAMIENSSFTGSEYGVSAVNLDEAVIRINEFTNTEMGVRLINITKTDVLGNIITSNQYSMQGIFIDNSAGNLRANIVRGHTNGIQLGNSSPDIGSNVIYDNKYHGIYIGIGSLPNMLGGRWVGDPPVFYATSGYNKIYENGGWHESNPPPNNDGSEIFINNANVQLAKGCNEIMDDRAPSSQLGTIFLMNGSFGLPIVSAEYNIWEVDPFYPLNSLRFGNLQVGYEPYYSEPCITPQSGGGGLLLSKSSGGEVIDTLYQAERDAGTFTENEILYSIANESFISGNYVSAEIYYDQIISSSDTTEKKLEAYSRKYSIGKLMKKGTVYFNNLQGTYSSLSQNTDNELLEKIFKQLSTKSKVGEQEYIPAIGEYDEIIQQNPGSEEAVYAEIDALTTALLVEGNDSTLGKTAGGRYLVKTTADYTDKINDILRMNFGSKNKTEEKEILPKEYTLYQNYPNPFNPVTTISYDLPKPGDVKLIIYDILGREVKTLINTQQVAGRHTVNFNASSLASGVYLYRLSINDFVDVKKMILLK